MPHKFNSKTVKTLQKTICYSNLICSKQQIFDTAGVLKYFTILIQHSDKKNLTRKFISKILTQHYKSGFQVIKQTLLKIPTASDKAINSYSYLADQIILCTYNISINLLSTYPDQNKKKQLSIIAIGGYGRGTMAPYSDIDLLFLLPHKLTPWLQDISENMLYILWDLGLKLGYAIRTIKECIILSQKDQTIQTTLLEHRFLIGDQNLAAKLADKLQNKLSKSNPKTYVAEKLKERENRHMRLGTQRYMLEPNIKNCKGGLRDLQTLYWITKYLTLGQHSQNLTDKEYFTNKERQRLEQAQTFLWMVRCHLHLYHRRAVEQLTFDAQIEIAKILGYKDKDGLRGVESFMQEYFRNATLVGDLTRIFLIALEHQHVKDSPAIGSHLLYALSWQPNKMIKASGYFLLHNRLAIIDSNLFLADPLNIMRIFEEALRSKILIHPQVMRLITANLHLIDDNLRHSPDAQQIFLNLLLDYSNPERALRRMNELGVLGAFIPEFGRIIAMMQFNIYHSYTVDEHTIQCISTLSEIERSQLKEDLPIASSILKGGVDRKVLYIALLLHDIGKGLSEDHSIIGAKIACNICNRFGFSEKEIETIDWLIKNHLLMSDVAQKRDVSDPYTIVNFARQIKTMQRLKLLTVLTVCDIRGVGPKIWSNWKARLLRELYLSCAAALASGLDKIGTYNRVDDAKSRLVSLLYDWNQQEIEQEINRHHDPYWQGLDLNAHMIVANLLRQPGLETMRSHIKQDNANDATCACFVVCNHPGIFSRITGAIALAQANIIDARTYTTKDNFTIAVFWLQDVNGKSYHSSRIERLHSLVCKILKGEMIARDSFLNHTNFKKYDHNFIVPTEITFDNEGSNLYTIIEVDTRDRATLLYDLTRTLFNINIHIARAVIATYGVQAVDVFYVKDIFGMKITEKAKQKFIIKKLKTAIIKGTKGILS